MHKEQSDQILTKNLIVLSFNKYKKLSRQEKKMIFQLKQRRSIRKSLCKILELYHKWYQHIVMLKSHISFVSYVH